MNYLSYYSYRQPWIYKCNKKEIDFYERFIFETKKRICSWEREGERHEEKKKRRKTETK